MTLIITEISEFGIAMVADSAVTFNEQLPSGETFPRVLNGAVKLQRIPYLHAGISIWGLGSINLDDNHLSTDIWLAIFIQEHSHIQTIDEFANALTEELQITLGNIQIPLGFHLAGYVENEEQNLPTFYHIRNVDGTFQHYDYHEFISGQDFPPQTLPANQMYITRNGDYGPYVILANTVHDALPTIKNAVNFDIPSQSLQGRLAYHVAWVRFVSDLYASSGLLRTIGGNIISLGISSLGQIVSYSS